MNDPRQEFEHRLLVLAPTARDAASSRDLLSSVGISCVICSSIKEVCEEASRGAGAALVTAESILQDAEARLAIWLRSQPNWSDLPLIVLTPSGEDSPKMLAALDAVGQMTLMKRPVQVSSLVSTVRSAMRDRRRQYAVRDADRKKDDFIALLAHELRNPLAPIRNGLQVLRLTQDEKVRDSSQTMMDRQLGHMVRLIDDLLDISRISRNKMELRRTRILLSDVISSAVETARPPIDAAKHELTVSLPPEAIYLDADLTRLAQVFSNLLTNSAKYTDPGGRIWMEATVEGNTVVVAVRDTGIGIPDASLATIFDMFSQVDRSIERSTGGLGIGLALVKGLVEMHGGTVTVQSDGDGGGTEFFVRLPIEAIGTAPLPHEPDSDARPVAGLKHRVLVVDDNRDSAESMATMLRLLGSESAKAYDGLEAVEIAETLRPEVILMDIGMPRLNGLEATRRIRQQPWGQEMVVIALTGWGQEGDRERSKEAGCDGHLVKPVSRPELERLLAGLKRDGTRRSRAGVS